MRLPPDAFLRAVAPKRRSSALRWSSIAVLLAFTASCSSADKPQTQATWGTASSSPTQSTSQTAPAGAGLLPGMPAPLAADDVYAADRPNSFSPTVAGEKPFVYVPNLQSNSVTVIDPSTYKIVRTVPVGNSPQHVVPSWDLKTLWVNNNSGNSLTPIDARTGVFGKPVSVEDPYNLYFTPDGKFAIVMAEALNTIFFRDPHTMEVKDKLPVKCDGVNHADFSPDGRYFIVTCEYSGDLIKVDTLRHKVIGQIHLPGNKPMPQDVKISPDGHTWYVADMMTSGLWIFDGDKFTTPTFLPTGDGAHGLYPSRDSKYLYIANRGEGSVSVLEFATQKVVKKWKIPGKKSSPDMGGVSADGKVLWLSGRYDNEVYAIDTDGGKLLARIKVGTEPHGLCFWPQPGRYSLGHTGILR